MWIECAMLLDGCCVWSFLCYDLVPSVYIVLLDQVFLVLIKVLGIRNTLLKGLIRKPCEEVLLSDRIGAGRGAVMVMVELRFPHKFV